MSLCKECQEHMRTLVVLWYERHYHAVNHWLGYSKSDYETTDASCSIIRGRIFLAAQYTVLYMLVGCETTAPH